MPKLTRKQKGFVKDYLETGNATQSALKNYDTTDYGTAAIIGHENLKKPNVREYLESRAERASEIVFELAETAEQETVRLAASKDILDRAGYKPVEKSMNVNVEVPADDVVKSLTKQLNDVYRGTGVSGDGGTTSPLGTEA